MFFDTLCVFFSFVFFKFLVFEGVIYANKDAYIIFGGRLIPWLLGSAASVELAHSLAHEVDVTRRCCLSLGEVQRVCSPRGGDLLCRPRTTKRSVQLTSVSQVDRACSTHATTRVQSHKYRHRFTLSAFIRKLAFNNTSGKCYIFCL